MQPLHEFFLRYQIRFPLRASPALITLVNEINIKVWPYVPLKVTQSYEKECMLKQTLLEILSQSTCLEIYFFRKRRLGVVLTGMARTVAVRTGITPLRRRADSALGLSELPLCRLPSQDRAFWSSPPSVGVASCLVQCVPCPSPAV